MLNSTKAKSLIEKNFPGWKIDKVISHDGKFIFLIRSGYPGEEGYESFVSVDQTSSAVKEYSVFKNGIPDSQILEKFRSTQ